MKKLGYLFLSINLLLFAACGDDDDSPAKLTSDNILGTWNFAGLET